MNRPIKFRAWDTEYRHMYANAYPFEHLVYVEMPHDEEEVQRRKSLMQEVNGKLFYFLLAKDVALMQFTGMLDKNGVEIYEGDILGLDDPQDSSRAIVVFRNAAFHAELVGTPCIDDPYWTTIDSNWVVIGNQFENPGLLPGSGEVQA